MIKIGTSGFDYDDWRGVFYPDGLSKSGFLDYYAQHFETLELNVTYYRMPTAKQLGSMLDRTDRKLEFAIKAHRSITHERTAGKADISHFNEAISPMRESGCLGAVLAQFPHSFHQNQENRVYIKNLVDSIGPPIVVELRSEQWATDPIVKWLGRIGAAYCCVDQPKLKGLMPSTAVAAAAPAYVRFHGRNGAKWYNHDQAYERYDYRYDTRELAEWAPKIRKLEDQAGKVMVFFNNHFQAKAVDGAKALRELLGSQR